MKNKSILSFNKNSVLTLLFFLVVGSVQQSYAQDLDTLDYVQFKGVVEDTKNSNRLEFATLSVNGTNISTVTNINGEFVLKVPKSDKDKSVTIAYIGFSNAIVKLLDFLPENTIIKLVESIESLPEVNIVSRDPKAIIEKIMANKEKNYYQDPLIMKAFYRESIKKRKTYASLSEAVVDIYKSPYNSHNLDVIKLHKARKTTDYRKVDTLVIKLQGGPYNTLHIDMVKIEDMFFNEEIFEKYKFTYEKTIKIDNRLAYVISFESHQNTIDPLFFGKLYVDASSFALSKAIFSLDLKDKDKASRFFVKKKPAKADVMPTVANFRIDYRIKDNKWYYGYSRIELTFKIDWNKKVFNSLYHITSEMAVTDWYLNVDKNYLKNKEKLSTTVILGDEASGFTEPEFWGELNVIEPEKSIENAIKKIQRQLK